jgi:hypothetical protein
MDKDAPMSAKAFRPTARLAMVSLLMLAVQAGGRLKAADQPETGSDSGVHASSSANGELHLASQYMERLVLLRFGHGEVVLESPAQVVLLPEGRYAWKEVYLKGQSEGCTFRAMNTDSRWLRISSDKPVALDVGGPLEPVVQVQRRGGKLVLSHRLQGADGQRYYSTGRTALPKFAVTHDGRAIGSGQFEYG